METTGKAFLEHWSWAAKKGLLNTNTAIALKSACTKVLGFVEDWESVDIYTLDIEDVLSQFENLSAKDLTPKSLRAYKRRFRQAIQSYKDYVQNPAGWKPISEQGKPKQLKPHVTPGSHEERITSTLEINPLPQGLVEYPFPLREDLVITLRLPKDLKLIEVKRITAFMKILSVDYHMEEE